MHPVRREGRTDTVVLYWFRTPPYVKVGRPALDEETRRQLEELYPDITFDWNRILREQPQPLPEREAVRRKEQRDARAARKKRKRPVDETGPAVADTDEPGMIDEAESDFEEASPVQTSEDSVSLDSTVVPSGAPPAAPGGAKRRRRRRRRKRPGGTPPNGSV